MLAKTLYLLLPIDLMVTVKEICAALLLDILPYHMEGCCNVVDCSF